MWAVAGTAMVVATLLGRAACLQPDVRQVPDPPAVPTVDADAIAQHLGAVIRHPTIASAAPPRPAFDELHATLRSLYPRTFAQLQVETVDAHGLILTWPGSEPSAPALLLAAHLDVVPVDPDTEPQWSQPPFAGHVGDGFVWGRGALDCKLGVVGILDAIEALLAAGTPLRRTVIVALGHDEEIGGQHGAALIAERLQSRGIRPWLALDEGGTIIKGAIPGVAGPVALIGVAEKGYASLDVVAPGEGGHSSMPPRQTSIGRLARAVERIEANPLPADLRGATRMMVDALAPHTPLSYRVPLANLWLFEPLVTWGMTRAPASAATVRTTTAFTMLVAGVEDNVLATKASAVVNFRILPGESVNDVIEHAREVVDDPAIEIACHDRCWDPSPVSDPTGEAFGLVRTTIEQVFPDAVVAPYLVVGATDARYYHAISEAALRFMPTRMTNEDRVRLHGIDERVAVSDLADAVRFYATVIVNASRID